MNEAAKEIERKAVVTVNKAQGMEVAAAVGTYHVWEDILQAFAISVILNNSTYSIMFGFLDHFSLGLTHL